MNLGGDVVAIDGGRRRRQNKDSGQKTIINYEKGHCVMYLRLPAKEK